MTAVHFAISSGRYAQSFFELAQKESITTRFLEELKFCVDLQKQSEEFNRLLTHPAIFSEKRRAVLQEVFGQKFHALTLRCLLFLERRKRLFLLEAIVRQMDLLFERFSGILPVEIFSAGPLSPDDEQNISKWLQAKFAKEIRLTVHIRPELISGFKFKIDDCVYDYSFQAQLRRFEQEAVL